MNYIGVVYAFFSTFFFAIIFNLTGKKILYTSFAGGLGWFTYLIFYNDFRYSKTAAYLIAAIVITTFSEIVGRRKKNTITSILIPALIPLVPGGGIYYTMSNFVEKNYIEASIRGRETLSLTVAISVGIFLVSTFSQIFYRTLKYLKLVKKYRDAKKFKKQLKNKI